MANAEIREWILTAPGTSLNPDGHYGLQCKDTADAYAMAIFGVNWRISMGAGNANQVPNVAPAEYWTWIANDPNNTNLIPIEGDVIIWGGNSVNPYGHIAVVKSATNSNVTVVQQDGFAPPLIYVDNNWYSNKPTHIATLAYDNYGTGPVWGWLRPKEAKIRDTGAAKRLGWVTVAPQSNVTLQGHQRLTKAAVNERTGSISTAKIVKTHPTDIILDFKGYVRGEKVGSTDIWFVGKYSGNYFHASGFTNSSTLGLVDLTPKKPTILSHQRKVGEAGVNERSEPKLTAKVNRTFSAGEVLNFRGYIRGDKVDTSDIWFVGKAAGFYFHSLGFTDSSTTGLTDLTPKDTALKANERLVVANVNRRTRPASTAASAGVAPAGKVWGFKGYVKGENVANNDIWFVDFTGLYLHSSAFKDATTTGLTLLKVAEVAPDKVTEPTEEEKEQEEAVDYYNLGKYRLDEQYDAINVTRYADVPAVFKVPRTIEYIYIHWWGNPMGQTYMSIINWFCFDKSVPSSAHEVISAGEVAVLVPHRDVAWANNNGKANANGITLEVNPRGSLGDWLTLARRIKDIREMHGKDLPLKRHMDVSSTECPGIYSDLDRIEDLVASLNGGLGSSTDKSDTIVVTPPKTETGVTIDVSKYTHLTLK